MKKKEKELAAQFKEFIIQAHPRQVVHIDQITVDSLYLVANIRLPKGDRVNWRAFNFQMNYANADGFAKYQVKVNRKNDKLMNQIMSV